MTDLFVAILGASTLVSLFLLLVAWIAHVDARNREIRGEADRIGREAAKSRGAREPDMADRLIGGASAQRPTTIILPGRKPTSNPNDPKERT